MLLPQRKQAQHSPLQGHGFNPACIPFSLHTLRATGQRPPGPHSPRTTAPSAPLLCKSRVGELPTRLLSLHTEGGAHIFPTPGKYSTTELSLKSSLS